MKANSLLLAGCLMIGVAPVAMAQSRAVTNTYTEMRSGPDGVYQVVATLSAGQQVSVYGCLQDYSWCDVSRNNDRGWVSAHQLNTYSSSGSGDVLATVGAVVGIGVVGFIVNDYWNRHYHDRPWYGHPPPPPPHHGGHRPPPPHNNGGHRPPPPPHNNGGHRPPPPSHGGSHPPQGGRPPQNGRPPQGGHGAGPGGHPPSRANAAGPGQRPGNVRPPSRHVAPASTGNRPAQAGRPQQAVARQGAGNTRSTKAPSRTPRRPR